MASSAASLSKGSITFSSGFFAQILDWDWDEITREAIETSHQGIAAAGAGKFGNKTFIPSFLVNPGKLKVKLHFNPDTLPPIGSAAETITLAIGDSSSQASWAGTGFMVSFKATGPLEGKMEADAEIQFTGNITRTAGT